MKIKFNSRQVGQILKNEAVREELERRAKLIHAAIDHDGYEVVSGVGKTRARAAVVASSQYARRSNAIHNTLVNNLDAGRG